MHALLDESEHPLLEATQKARELLSKTAFERLAMVDGLAKDRALAIDVAVILQQMARISLQTAAGKPPKNGNRCWRPATRPPNPWPPLPSPNWRLPSLC